jgi:hypothetical protein
VNEEGKVNVSLLVGKSRVTPMKPVTIPRLELTAAVLAVKLNCQVQKEIEITIHCVMFWTDSMVVLQYINNESKRFQTFVANRLAVIVTCHVQAIDVEIRRYKIQSSRLRLSRIETQ